MPNIDSIPVELYQPLTPYTSETDNIPLIGLISRLDTVNDAVDLLISDITIASGDQGSLSNRLSQSLEANGDLTPEAIDLAQHSIEEHADTVNYVRMTSAERSKLDLISVEANRLIVVAETDNVGDVTFTDTTLTLENSGSIIWNYVGGKLSADIDFPSSVRHNHFYNVIPITSNHKNYFTTTLHTAYKEGSLRVYVNGIRLNTTSTTPVPFSSSGTVVYSNLKFSEGISSGGIVSSGDFSLSSTISSSGVVVVDFDVLYTP